MGGGLDLLLSICPCKTNGNGERCKVDGIEKMIWEGVKKKRGWDGRRGDG